MVNHSNGDTGITRAASYWHREGITHESLKPLLPTDVHKVLATITAKLQEKMERNADE